MSSEYWDMRFEKNSFLINLNLEAIKMYKVTTFIHYQII